MGKKNDETLALVREALDQLRRGDIVDAIATLERTAFPKWEDVQDSQIHYQMTMTPDADYATVCANVYYPPEREAAPTGAVG